MQHRKETPVRRLRWRLVAAGALLLAVFVVGSLTGLGGRLGQIREWLRALGAWGPSAFIGVYALAVTAAVPASIMTVMGGVLFGWVYGTLYVSLGATLGAAVSFLVARYVARGAVVRHIAGNYRFEQIDNLTESQGAVVVALLRLIPVVPFFLMNYGLGLTKVRFTTYVLSSWVGILPTTVLYVVGGHALVQSLVEGRLPIGLLAVFVGVICLLLVLVSRLRTRLPLA